MKESKEKNGVPFFIFAPKKVGQFEDKEKLVFEQQMKSQTEDLTIKECCTRQNLARIWRDMRPDRRPDSRQ